MIHTDVRSTNPLPNSVRRHDGAFPNASSTPIAADRLYQIAALTAGFFLLATLL